MRHVIKVNGMQIIYKFDLDIEPEWMRLMKMVGAFGYGWRVECVLLNTSVFESETKHFAATSANERARPILSVYSLT